MMKTIYWMGITAILILMSACQQNDDSLELADNCVDFQLRFQPQSSQTRAATEIPEKLFWDIFDAKGKRVTYYKSMIKNENQSIFVEGLPNGEYSMVVVGESTPVTGSKTSFLVPDQLDSRLIDYTDYQPTDSLPGNIYYKKIAFTVANGDRQQIKIELQNVLARVDFKLQAKNPFLLSTITSVKVSLNEATKAAITADKMYVGERNVKSVDITNSRTLLILPTPSRTIGGTVEVTAKLTNGQLQTSKYNFQVKATEGELSTVNINYSNQESELGLMRIPRSYYTKTNSLTMFKDDEPESISTDRSRRSFTVRTPLQLVVDKENKRLTMRFFSPIEIHDVKILAKRRTDTEFFEVLQLDNVPAFIETHLPLTMLTETVSYKTESGKQITVTPPTEIVPSDYEFKVVCNDLFMHRVSKIRSNYRVCFNRADPTRDEYSLPMTPRLCRHVTALMLNMCYLFGSDFFWETIAKEKYYRGDNQRITNAEFEERLITNSQYIAFTRLKTKPGVGGGEMLALADFIMSSHYIDTDFFGGGIYVLYHELAHALGYGHDSSMAGSNGNMGKQGSFPVTLYFNVFLHLKQHNDMPVLYYRTTENVVNEF